MDVNKVIEYLKNDQIAIAVRYQVLTGFDTQLGNKRSNEHDWIAKMSKAGILQTLGQKEFYQGGTFAAGASWLMGNNEPLDVTMKNLYKAAIPSGGDQASHQKAYINKVTSLLEKYKDDDCFKAFEFDEPATVIANTLKSVENKREVMSPV